jgi:hypothetical protein
VVASLGVPLDELTVDTLDIQARLEQFSAV